MRLCRKCRRSKLLQAMGLLRLGLVHKKVLLFVNSINEGFRLRLFLEAFGIRSAVLNAELPLNSRHHILQVLGYLALPTHTRHVHPKPDGAQCECCTATLSADLPLYLRHHIHCLSSMSLMHASVC